MFQLFKSMDVKSFDHQFPHLAGQDTYRMSLADVDPEVDGVYDLVDYYCLDLDCDCRKVIIFVLDSRKQQMATIAYSRESISFYIALGADQEFAESLSRGILEPLAVAARSYKSLGRALIALNWLKLIDFIKIIAHLIQSMVSERPICPIKRIVLI